MEKNKFLSLFKDDLLTLGVQTGSTLMVHAALRPFGNVPGGAETIIEGLLTVLGKSGTLLLPALSYETVTLQNPVFDICKTPSCVGIVSETFRLRAGTQRSLHPTHSVCAVGPLAKTLLSFHIKDTTPCGKHSPFNQLPKFNGQILMLACSLIYNTSLHAVEELIKPPYLYDQPITYTLIDHDAQVVKKEYIPHNFRGWRQRYDRVARLLTEPFLRSGPVAGVSSTLLDSRSLWEAATNALNKDKLFFVEKTNL